MPDTRFSLAMLKEHLRKYFAIYLVGIALCLFGTSLLWTTTRPRPDNDESVIVYMVCGYADAAALKPVSADMLSRCRAEDPRLQQVDFQWLMFGEDENDYTGSMLLMTRLAVGEGDAFLADEKGLAALVQSGAVQPLDDLAAEGWLSEYGLEPYEVTLEDEESGERTALLAALRLDAADGLRALGAMDNRGAYLCLSTTSDNPETTRRALEILFEDLAKEAAHAGTENP